MAERIYESMSRGVVSVAPVPEDFPSRIVEEWRSSFGDAVSSELARVLAEEAPLSLRASSRFGAKALLKELKGHHALPVQAEISSLVPFGVRLAGYAPILSGSAYEKGLFEIQDEGSQLMALLALWPELYGDQLQKAPGRCSKPAKVQMPPQKTPAWTVVDACAGAGGKSLALADALGGKGRVFSYDTSETKLQALRRRASRAGLRNIQAVAVEESGEEIKLRSFAKSADVVLVDAPCSGWGVLRRNPDIKWRQDPEVLERMPRIQSRLLSLYSSLVKPGGRLVFGVCTFRKAETVEIVQEFLSKHPEFSAGPGGYFGPGPTDGFFIQVFQR
jgi:16S rRNA (cytosine967-C5)-methyltransferase